MITIHETPTRLIVTGDETELEKLKEAFRYHPKDYFRFDTYQVWKMTAGEQGWDGYRYPFFRRTGTAYEVLRGRKDEVLAFCKSLRIYADTNSCFRSPFDDLTPEQVPDGLIAGTFDLDARQRNGVAQLLRHGIGTAHFAVNSGKTALFAGCAAMIKAIDPGACFLYFTPTERLVTQTVTWMRTFLPDWEIGQYGGGKHEKDAKDMVVCTLAILTKHFTKLARDGFFKRFIAILIDESHHSQSPTAERVLRESPAFYRLAASDTLKADDPDKWNKILGLCGPVRCTVTTGEMIVARRSAAPLIYLVDVHDWTGRYKDVPYAAELGSTAWTLMDGQWVKGTYAGPVYEYDANNQVITRRQRVFNYDTEKWEHDDVPVTVPLVHLFRHNGVVVQVDANATLLDRRYDKAIIRFKERNQLICDWAHYYAVENNWQTVVVCTRTTHVIILETLLAGRLGAERVRSLYAKHTPKQRDQAFAWFKATPGAVLVTPLIQEGVSINEIRAGIIADAIADWEKAKQIIGRFIRKKEDTEVAHVTWFIDRQHPRYVKNALALFDKLQHIEGYRFYHPVAGPDSIASAQVHHGEAPEPEEKAPANDMEE